MLGTVDDYDNSCDGDDDLCGLLDVSILTLLTFVLSLRLHQSARQTFHATCRNYIWLKHFRAKAIHDDGEDASFMLTMNVVIFADIT